MLNHIGFLEINKSVEYYHLNTALGNEILDYLKSEGVVLSSDFIAKLRSNYESDV